jgi:hypothetical protein
MFQVCMIGPVYGSRDEFLGSRISVLPEYPPFNSAERAGWLAALLNTEMREAYEADGCGSGDEPEFIVCEIDSDGYPVRRPAPPPRLDDGSNDIPF